MTLAAGTKLGPYEIVSPLGAGGMGEVYRARDDRLGREVAIKVLPADLASNAERLRRFEKEARSASALSHPNIVTVYDIGASEGVSWIAMERVDGETLRILLAAGAIPRKKLLAWATQIAEGLARAHAAGIVHRDLKPENVMITRDGIAKILDFGLAKVTERSADGVEVSQSPTASLGTEAGVVLGTVGYMSPEQARGDALDFRSDQFSFGSILYEMASGKRAFERPSAPETMAAIIRDEPEPLASAASSSPLLLRWIVGRCLAKDPEERYASTKDLARDLAQLRDGASEASLSGSAAAVSPSRPTMLRAILVAAAAVAVVAAGVAVFLAKRPPPEPPLYRPLTFHRGSIGAARFAPDGKTVLYAAAWQGGSAQIYSTRLDGVESAALSLPTANLLSISNAGRLAILLGRFGSPGVIAEVPLAGGAPRELVETDRVEPLELGQTVADWSPTDERLAIVRKGNLEFPVGRVLVPAAADRVVVGLRFSPDGRQIAFVQRQGGDVWSVGVVDLPGKSRILSPGWEIISSLAWHPRTGEIWFSGREADVSIGVIQLHAVSLSGAHRVVARTPQLLIVEDVARDGRILARSDDWPENMMCLPPGASKEVDLTWLDFSMSVALSTDGRDLLFMEGGAGAGAKGGVYMRKTDGSTPAVRLGDGNAQDLSPDRKWVVQAFPDRVVLLPVGPGESRTIQDRGIQYHRALWFADGRRLLLQAAAPGHAPRLYVRDIASGPPRPFTPEGVRAPHLSPTGTFAVGQDASGKRSLYPVDGGEPRPLPAIEPGEGVIGFDSKAENVYIGSGGLPMRIDKLDLATGKRTFFREITLSDTTGADTIDTLQLTPDGKCYCYSFMRSLSRLYLVEGLR
jgi:hypothetical protein